jgi:prepilin-type N-terminal cleavage/methylation domain-containing protein
MITTNLPRSCPMQRRGFTFVEVLAASAMLTVLLATVAQLVVLVKRHSRAAEHYALAERAVENCLEEITQLPWDDITDDRLAGWELPREVKTRWPQAQLTGAVTLSSEPVDAKRISLELDLRPDARDRVAKLSAWVYRDPRE